MKCSAILSLQWLLLFSVIFSFFATGTSSRFLNFERHGISRRLLESENYVKADSTEADFHTFYFNQTVDHFVFDPENDTLTYRQKYIVSEKWWAGANANAPIIAYVGCEAAMDYDQVSGVAFLQDIALRFKGLLVYMEHRYYGESIPYGSMDEIEKDKTKFRYLTSAQALEDYAVLLLHIKKKYGCPDCPVLVFGGSYGGMLATWFRLKYPHIATGALASSAPMTYIYGFKPTNLYYSIVAKDFKDTSPTCYNIIHDSWAEIDKVGATPEGLAKLSKIFKTCSPLESTDGLKQNLEGIYRDSAQYDNPPNYPVRMLCDTIEKRPPGTDILTGISAGMVSKLIRDNPNATCFVNSPPSKSNETEEMKQPDDFSWNWQTCVEVTDGVASMTDTGLFQDKPDDNPTMVQECRKDFNITPRKNNWLKTHYGGLELPDVLRRFGSNIIFSNGLRDPYSTGGILETLSDSVIALVTEEGAHCTDLGTGSLERDNEPDWLVNLRKQELQIMEKWLAEYYADLRELNHN